MFFNSFNKCVYKLENASMGEFFFLYEPDWNDWQLSDCVYFLWLWSVVRQLGVSHNVNKVNKLLTNHLNKKIHQMYIKYSTVVFLTNSSECSPSWSPLKTKVKIRMTEKQISSTCWDANFTPHDGCRQTIRWIISDLLTDSK